MKRIYLDYASLTPINKDIIKEMKKYSKDEYSNPSSIHLSGIKARNAIEQAKDRIAKVIHSHNDEIIFTSGGTESNNLVLENKINKHIIISEIEHSSIIRNEKIKNNLTIINVNKDGIVDLELLKKSINPDTTLISIMFVNNEIGVIEPIHDIAKIIRDARKKTGKEFPLLHIDASQAMIHIPIYVEKLGADIITLDGGKIYGPRGIGMLYIKRGSMNIIRNGTANLPSIMGFAYAMELIEKRREKETTRIMNLKKFFFDELIKINKDIKVNGNLINSSPHILNISIPNIDNEFFLLQLDAQCIECSTKSACLEDEEESYVLKAIGSNSKNSIRFSFGINTKKRELKRVLKVITQILQKQQKSNIIQA